MNTHYKSYSKPSKFDGSLLGYLGWAFLGKLLTFFTLGLAYPWAMVNMYRWEINHTVIEGKRLEFIGTGWGLFGHWLKWWFLMFITLGIYGFWVHIKLLEWKTKHTIIVDTFYDF